MPFLAPESQFIIIQGLFASPTSFLKHELITTPFFHRFTCIIERQTSKINRIIKNNFIIDKNDV